MLSLESLLSTVAYSMIGLLFFGLSFLLMRAVIPFSIRKEIEEDQNVALAVVMGAVLIGQAIIIAAVVSH